MARTEREKWLATLSPLDEVKAGALEKVMRLMFALMLDEYIRASTYKCIREDLQQTLEQRAPQKPAKRVKKPAAKRKGKRT